MNDDPRTTFEDAARAKPQSFIAGLWGLLAANKKWWLFPVLATMLLLGVVLMLSGSVIAPFIYTLF